VMNESKNLQQNPWAIQPTAPQSDCAAN